MNDELVADMWGLRIDGGAGTIGGNFPRRMALAELTLKHLDKRWTVAMVACVAKLSARIFFIIGCV